jgi:hypothetical protein
MLPEQYLHVKKTMISAVINKPFFNKRDAQVWFRMDVNKVNHLFNGRPVSYMVGLKRSVGFQKKKTGI